MCAVGGCGFVQFVGKVRSSDVTVGSVVIVATNRNRDRAVPSCAYMNGTESAGRKLYVLGWLHQRYELHVPSSRGVNATT